VLFVLKLSLVPGLIAFVSLAGRWWGPRIGGLLAGLPLVAGPVLLFLAIEQGPTFAARAALSTLAALVGVASFCVAYAWVSLSLPWPAGLLVGWAAFALAILAVHAVPWRPSTALVAALVSFAVGRALLPKRRGSTSVARWPVWDLWLRMGLAVALVLITTGLAAQLGPVLSGMLTPFPVAISVLAAFAHAQQGSSAVLRLLEGLLPSMGSFSAFCWILTLGLEPLGVAPAFALALAVQLAIQALLLAWMWRSRW
jgi:hypothetical protein